MFGGGLREFMNDADGPAFLERELVGLGVDVYQQVRVCLFFFHQCVFMDVIVSILLATRCIW